ncbi:alpha/beta hydrolase [Brevibacillus thermoruber]|uniref:alpha/beta hydrolase n=1 Tax=Brevibacillus thermoruber TaxID=33942 RepID=UPI00040BD684|nr:alpha/beta hydrolase [Brevibacillus thermoruber]
MDCYFHAWTVADPSATVVLVHGTGEHHGRYRHVAAFLNAHGVDVFSGDLPGWGRSPGKKGHIDSFGQYLDAVETWTERALQAAGDERPVFLLGHSLGGLVAVRFVQRYEKRRRLAGLMLSSPCLQLKVDVPAWKARLAQWLDRAMPRLVMANGITADMVSRDPQVQAEYVSDPYNYPKVSVRWFQELHRAMRAAWEEREQLDLSVLVLQAGDDQLVDPDGVERFAAGLPAEVTFVRFPGLRHEVLNEPEREDVLRQMVEWLKGHGGRSLI